MKVVAVSVPDVQLNNARPLRQTLRLITLAWVFGAVWMHITTGAVMTRYAKALGVEAFGFGLLAAIPFAGALVQLPASYLMEKYGRRKRMFITAGIAHRSMWLVIAAIPWIAPEAGWWWMLMLALAISTAMANMINPPWITWMADTVPERIRGRYFSRRGQYGRAVGVVTTVLIGFALDRATQIDPLTLRRVISGVLVIGALCGITDIAMFRGVPDHDEPPGNPDLSLGRLLAEPLRDRNFRRFLGFGATLTFAVGYVGQFIWLYLFDVLGMSNLKANVMLVAVPLTVSLLTFPLWGRLVDRLGCRPVLAIAGLMIVHGGASWVFVTKDHWWLGYLAVCSATAAWPGVELATANLLMNIGATESAERRHSAYVAVYSIVIAAAGVASGLFGGVFAQTMRDWHGSLMGVPLTYHGLLLLISAALRLSALIWLIGLEEHHAYSARAAIRYMAANIYSNVQQSLFAPARGLVRLGRFTFNLLPGRTDEVPSDETAE